MNKIVAVLLFFICIILPSAVKADHGIKSVIWSTPIWEGITDEQGIYTIVFKEIAKRCNFDLSIHIRPFKRALIEVASGKSDLTGGVLKPPEGTIAIKLPIFQTKVSLLMRSDIVDFSKDKDAIYKLKISATYTILESSQIDPSKFIHPIEIVKSRKQALLMLTYNRVDGYIDADFEIDRTARNENIDLRDFYRQPVIDTMVFMVVTDNERGREIKQLIDNVLAHLYKEKFIEKLYLEKGFTPPIIE